MWEVPAKNQLLFLILHFPVKLSWHTYSYIIEKEAEEYGDYGGFIFLKMKTNIRTSFVTDLSYFTFPRDIGKKETITQITGLIGLYLFEVLCSRDYHSPF